eukprot:34710-Ditylum_brightwellii.AAC.1
MRQNMIKNNERENEKRLEYEYRVGEYVLIVKSASERRLQRKMNMPTEGPYKILKVFKNGTIKIQRGYTEKINTRRVKPYKKATEEADAEDENINQNG